MTVHFYTNFTSTEAKFDRGNASNMGVCRGINQSKHLLNLSHHNSSVGTRHGTVNSSASPHLTSSSVCSQPTQLPAA